MKRVLYILGLLEDTDIDWMVSAGERVEVPSGEDIISEGKRTGYMYIVLDGAADVVVNDNVVASIGKGEVVGEISLLDSRPPTATSTST